MFLFLQRKSQEPRGKSVILSFQVSVKLNSSYVINSDQRVSGQILKKIGLRRPLQFNGVNKSDAQLFGDFQSYLYEVEKIK